jgi:RNA polymerase sigma-70 factor (ECF subfamily)
LPAAVNACYNRRTQTPPRHADEWPAVPADPPFSKLMTRLRDGDPDAAAAVFDRFARRLVRLAGSRLPHALAPKLDAEDVVQSVFKSFFLRQADGRLTAESWDGLWTILTVLTVRKCGHKVSRFRAARRDVGREAAPAAGDSGPVWEAPAPEPRPEEAVLLAETLDEVLRGLREDQRPIVLLRLQGFLQREIAERVGCTERTVERVLRTVREGLEAKER